jgi:hypothetical protein
MKTNIVCPNKNAPAWKILVDAIGEDLAYLSFFRNHDVIPDVATARAILGLKEPVEAAKPVEIISIPTPEAVVGRGQSGRHVVTRPIQETSDNCLLLETNVS